MNHLLTQWLDLLNKDAFQGNEHRRPWGIFTDPERQKLFGGGPAIYGWPSLGAHAIRRDMEALLIIGLAIALYYSYVWSGISKAFSGPYF